MPNQRDETKIEYSYWMTSSERRLLREVSVAYGVAQSDLIKLAICEMAKRKGISEKPSKDKENHNER